VLIPVRDAWETGVALLARAGVPAEAADLQVDLLIEAELRGHPSHGLLRLPRILERIANGVASPTARGRHAWRGTALLEVDGQQGLGPVVAVTALKEVGARARTTGVACAVISASNHLGMLAWYAERVSAAGQILIGVTTSEALVHPWGGAVAMVGSNPVTIGIPAVPHPLVLDMATAIISMGKVHDHAIRGLPLQPGWAVDSGGSPTVDPDRAKGGAIAPFGGAKGYGLGIAIEALVGALTSSAMGRDVAGTLDSVHPATKGDVFIVLQPPDPGRGEELGQYFDAVRSSARVPGGEPVSVPGDRSRLRRARSTDHGIDVPDDLWAQLRAGLSDETKGSP
jgi:LDH2 family malate/lactate/ureidoglycolate dehydrogenase